MNTKKSKTCPPPPQKKKKKRKEKHRELQKRAVSFLKDVIPFLALHGGLCMHGGHRKKNT